MFTKKRFVYFLFSVILLSAIHAVSFSQTIPLDKGILRLRIAPLSKRTVFLDDTIKLSNLGDFLADSGIYTLKTWEAGYFMLDTLIHIQGGKKGVVNSVLKKTPELEEWELNYARYARKKIAWVAFGALPIFVTAIFTNQYVKSYDKAQLNMDRYYNESLEAKKIYENTQDFFLFQQAESNFNRFQNLYKEEKEIRDAFTRNYVAKLSITAIATACFYTFVKQPNKPNKPTFKNPLANANLYINQTQNGLCFTIQKTF
jgi:hypothetical protein